MLIEGEAGVGKLTLADAVIEAAHLDPARVARIDAAAIGADGAALFVRQLQRELELQPQVLLIRHLESLTADTTAATASALEGAGPADWTPRVIGTLTTSGDATTRAEGSRIPGFQRLIDLIAVGRVVIPPLRDRREDISEAVSVLLKAHSGRRTLSISSAAQRTLMRAPWPGNLRQLDSTVRGLVSTAPGFEILPEHLPADLLIHAHRRQLSPIEELELSAILDALQRHHGNKFAAANAIGISRSTLYRKLRSYHVDPDRMYF
jgi:DNA-binding NtrC family response regulator